MSKLHRNALSLLLGLAAGTVQGNEVTLPHFRTANDFGGKTVARPDQFVATTNDYTLEVQATKGKTITVGFGQISYTPCSDGTVRFVQKDGIVYVFENKSYTTQVKPVYSYTATDNDIVRNGSFEQVDEQLTTGRWKATGWQTWDGGTPTWGTEAGYVNVRENAKYRSDGTKSIILHSRSKWLCQQITAGALEAGAAYQLTCDYWTSEGNGNGNASYQIWIGSSLATNDILTAEGYTTSGTDNDKHTFSTILQMPDKLPSEIYLSFYRELSKVDWIDNVRLVKISPDRQGISGTSQATYATGAYAPSDMSLPEGVSIDMTARIVNSGFDNSTMTGGAPQGWTLDANVTQSKISTAAKGNLIEAGQNHWQLWQSGGNLTGKATQTLTGLPNGRYEVGADVVPSAFSGTVGLIANYGSTDIASAAGRHYTTTGIVVDGTLQLGLSFQTSGSVTLDFDSFTLHYQGMDENGYREVLRIKIKETKSVADNIRDGYDVSLIQKTIDAAESLPADAPTDEIIEAIKNMDSALDDYQLYVEQQTALRKNYESFKSYVNAAEEERKAYTYPGTEAFDEAIARAKAFLSQLEADMSLPTTEQAKQLNAARETYYNSQYTVKPVEQTVSCVDLSLNGSEKYVLRVDGKPFYPTEIQVRPDKLRGYLGWSDQEIEAAFKRAADDNFSTLSIPVFWSEVEPEKDHFDWRILDQYLGWCKKYNVKMEILWFSWSSGGRVQYLWNYNGRQQLRTPDYVCSLNGTSEYNMLRTEWEYSLDWRDKNLRDRETYVLERIMDHVALWDANNGQPHTVIGVQLGNEARAHGNNSATASEIIDYYHHVGSGVKKSMYVTWTRLNCVSYETSGRTGANESKRNNGGTNIDFVGIDVYGTNAGNVKGNVNGQLGSNGKNYRMIMEIDAKDANSPLYQMAALAGDKAFDYYNLGPVDGNGLYGNDRQTLTERSHISLVRQRNKMLRLANQDIAIRKQGSGLYVYNYAGTSTNTEKGLNGIAYTPAVANTQAVAVKHNDHQIALLTTNRGTFTLPDGMEVTAAEKGHFDQNNKWVKEDDIIINDNKITLTTTGCVLVTLDGYQSPDAHWGDEKTNAWSCPTTGTFNSGSTVQLEGAKVTLGSEQDNATTWTFNNGNQGMTPSQMPTTNGTVNTLITSFSEKYPYGALPQYGCYFMIECTENGTITFNCKPSTDSKQKLVFVTFENENPDNIEQVRILSNIWDNTYSFNMTANKRYCFFQLAYPDKLNEYRFSLRGITTKCDKLTGIKDITSNPADLKTIETDEFYDLMGRKVNKPAKGIYILNGRKISI